MKLYKRVQESRLRNIVEIKKAYGRVPREELYWCMRDKGLPEKYIRVVEDMYEHCMTEVKCAVGTTQTFPIEVGLHQGSALSQFLFAIIMDSLTKDCRKKAPWHMKFANVKTSGILCDESMPSKVKGRIHMTVIQPAMIYGMETVPLRTRDTKTLEVAENGQMGMWPHIERSREERSDSGKVRKHAHHGTVHENSLRWFGLVLGKEC
ncbi:uncharacterized protein [Penaeus vannamei]|uniref:uncharacterized protein n=1 Tax=Penaeus vannamei TaxID=6689 RepID=UPI00387F5FA3